MDAQEKFEKLWAAHLTGLYAAGCGLPSEMVDEYLAGLEEDEEAEVGSGKEEEERQWVFER